MMNSRSISSLHVVVAILSISFASAAKSEGSSTKADFKKEVAAAIRERARLTELKDGPLTYTRHQETDPDECSAHCTAKGGDGRCDGSCYTRACLMDLGDCPSRAHRSCHQMHCSKDRCDSDCFFNGCPSKCDLSSGLFKEYVLMYSPQLSPMRLHDQFASVERRIKEQSGLGLQLRMLYGMVTGAKHEPYAHMWMLYPKRSTYNSSISLWEVTQGHVDPKDEETMDVIMRMGTDKYFSQVSPILLSEPQYSLFAPFSSSYDDQREKKEQLEECARTGNCY